MKLRGGIMAYINFKEEKSAARSQLNKREKNNNKIFEEIRKTKKLPLQYNPDEEYSYKDFKDRNFGKKILKGEEEFTYICEKDIVCSMFTGCNFHNLKFYNCKFIGCKFVSCFFQGGGVSFENCTFIKEESEILPSLNRRDNFSCEFNNCNLYGRFSGCTLGYTIFKNSNIKNTNFEVSDMENVIMMDCDLHKIIFTDVDLSGAKIVNTYIEDLEFRDKYKTKIDEKTFIDKIPIRYKTREEYEGIYMVYENIGNKFKENTLNNNFGEYYYLGRTTEFKTLKPLPKIGSFIQWITCGYGERPIFAVYSSLGIIFIFSLLYLVLGIKIDEQIIRYGMYNRNFSTGQFIKDYVEALDLSIGMFAGVGVNNAQPTIGAYIASGTETLIGVVMMGIGIGTLTKKLVR